MSAAPIAVEADRTDSKRTRERTKRGKTTGTDAEFTRQSKAAAKRAERARKAVRLQLVGVEGNITRTRTQSTAWFVQEPGPWNMRR
ncbi:hypothetical protein NJ76_31310 [Rhodococcus sp. IITR03]|nr:hypothetical protein NJ76_31310 [Rhodococcus sp. IITR03]